jgi:hypothetical protein
MSRLSRDMADWRCKKALTRVHARLGESHGSRCLSGVLAGDSAAFAFLAAVWFAGVLRKPGWPVLFQQK